MPVSAKTSHLQRCLSSLSLLNVCISLLPITVSHIYSPDSIGHSKWYFVYLILTISHMKTNTLPALFLACSQNEQMYNWRTVRTRSAVIYDNLSTTSISFPNYLWIFSLEAEKESGGERKSLTKPSSAKYLCCHHVLWRVGCRLNDICNESKTLDGHINSLYSIKDD